MVFVGISLQVLISSYLINWLFTGRGLFKTLGLVSYYHCYYFFIGSQ